MDGVIRSGLEQLRDGFAADAVQHPGFNCTMYQEHCGHELRHSIYNPLAFRHLHEHHRGMYGYGENKDTFRALYFQAPAVEGHYPSVPDELLTAPFEDQRRFFARHLAAPLFARYQARASTARKYLEALEHPICASYARTEAVGVWTWALFDWSWSLDHHDVRFVTRWSQPPIDCGQAPIHPGQLRERAAKEWRKRYLEFVDQWEKNPPRTFNCHIADVFSKSVEFCDWLLTEWKPPPTIEPGANEPPLNGSPKPDGPFGGDGFCWHGIDHRWMPPRAWKLVNVAWNGMDHCCSFDDAHEAVHGDDIGPNDPLGGARKDANAFFRKHAILLQVKVSGKSRSGMVSIVPPSTKAKRPVRKAKRSKMTARRL